MERAGVAEAAGVSPTSSGFRANLYKISGLGLAEFPDGQTVRATDILFPAGLA